MTTPTTDLFLDIDGVLNSRLWWQSPECEALRAERVAIIKVLRAGARKPAYQDDPSGRLAVALEETIPALRAGFETSGAHADRLGRA